MLFAREIMQHKYQLLLHLLFWTGLGYLMFFINRKELNNAYSLSDAAISLLFYIAIFYINWSLLVPRFLSSGKPVKYLGVVLLLWVVAVFSRIIFDYVSRQLLGIEPNPKDFTTQFYSYTVTALVMIIFSSAYRIPYDLIRGERTRRELEHEKTKAELAFLKSQVSPHFLFNTLNSLYALSYKQSPKTPDAILKLSHLMRYMLYEAGDGGKVALEKEVEYLQNYIDLQRLRLPDSEAVVFTHEGPLIGQVIEPMLLIPLVENIFKHGFAEPGAPIKIHIEIKEKELNFTASNKTRKNDPIVKTGGIGLQNVQRRLELLYGGRHRLEVSEQSGVFFTHLRIQL